MIQEGQEGIMDQSQEATRKVGDQGQAKISNQEADLEILNQNRSNPQLGLVKQSQLAIRGNLRI